MSDTPLSLKQRFKLSRFFRGEALIAGPITLNQRRIFILPTKRGLGFVLLVALLLLIAFVYNNNLAYLLGFLLASIFFVTILHSFKALNGLEIQAGFNQPVFAGDMAGFNLHVLNPSNQFRQAIEIGFHESLSFDFEPQQSRTVRLPLIASRRGWLQCGTITVSSRFPLGLFRAWSPLRFDSKLLVYPKPAAETLPFPETDAGSGQQGQNKHNGDEFYGLKTYQIGDSIRQIHWKSFAKGQGVHSKQYAGASSVELWLDFTQTPGSDIEARLSQLCRWVIDAERAGLRYGLRLPNKRIELDCGKDHYQQCLQALALV